MSTADLIRTLVARGETLAVAESLTGGALAAAIVDTPGASAAFRGGIVAYATDLKCSLVGVPEELLARRGPVDADVALALAVGAARACRARWGLATTGVAGPDPQDGVPVGTVYVAAARLPGELPHPDGPSVAPGSPSAPDRPDTSDSGWHLVRALALTGDRAEIRRQTVVAALTLMMEALAGAAS
jgi:nicotinamide-nucleotide amidase